MLLALGLDRHTQVRLESEHFSGLKLWIEHIHFKKETQDDVRFLQKNQDQVLAETVSETCRV